MELAGTVKCLLCRGRQPFDKRCFDEMEMHLKSQHRVIFFMKELIQCTKDAKNKEEILAAQTIDVDMAVKQEDEGDIIVEYEHFSTSEQTVDEGGDSILVEDDDIPSSERDSLMEADASANEVLEDLPVASAQDSGGVPDCVNKPEIYNANQAAINFNPAIVASISDKHPVDIAARCDVNNAVDIIDENFVELNTTFPIVNERNEDLTDLLREQSNANIEPNELTNNCNLNNQLALNSSVEALIDNLMSTEAFVNDMNWIVQAENAKIGDYPDSFDNDASLLYTSEKSPESSSFLHPSNSKASLEMSNSKELHVNIQEYDNTSNDECDEILTSNSETASILDKLDAFVDTPTRIMEIIHKPSETVDTTVLPSTDTKSSLDISKGSVKLASDMCESPQKSKGWYDLVPRGNANVSSTNNRKRRMVFDNVQSESKKKFKSPLDSVSFYENDKKDQALKDRKKLKCDECNMRYASKQTLKNHVCKGHSLMFKIKKCRVNLLNITQKKSAITNEESHAITHKESHTITQKENHAIAHMEHVQYPANNNLISCKKQGCSRMFENPFELKDHEFSVHLTSGPRDHTEEDRKDESYRKLGESLLDETILQQGNKDKGKPFVCEGCGKPFSSEHGKKVHKMKMHS